MTTARGHRAAVAWSACLVLLVVGSGARATPGEWSCQLTYVVDGDTIHARCHGEKVKVRLLRIDTVERNEPGYAAAGAALRRLLGDGPIELEFEKPEIPVKDEYGRLLAYVRVRGENANVEMVRLGWSRFWTKYGAGRYADDFRRAEREARDAKRGMWAADASAAVAPASSPPRHLVADACRPRAECCRVCTRGEACGDACISASAACEHAGGCACDAEEVCASSR